MAFHLFSLADRIAMSEDNPQPDRSHGAVERRRWAFEQAQLLRAEMDDVRDLIFKASEIETYLTAGQNPRDDFFSCVEVSLSEVEHASIPGVSDSSKAKVLEAVRHWLKEYKALDD